ncbi:MAG TPA: ORF6N domain-containing protein [Opitutaceae bacterium]|nr:ORF6N domain-containing protein [Opitutaceae bacterium]
MIAKKPKAPALPQIFNVRRQRVVLDADLAVLFGVETKVFNQAIRRNWSRFPADFIFQITKKEFEVLMSQIVTSKTQSEKGLRSQFVTLKKGRRGQHSKYLPWVFTEHGAIMAAMVLHSDRAVAMSVYVVRAFMEMRDKLMANAAILKRLAEIDHRLLEHDVVLREVVERLQPLLDAPDEDGKNRRKIGFHEGNR